MIMLIDDEPLMMESYLHALKRVGFSVRVFADVDSALVFVQKSGPSVELIVMDLMMPPGRAFMDRETDFGLRTGVLMLPEIRRALPEVPVFVLTNVRSPWDYEELLRDPNVELFRKIDCTPSDLADNVSRVLGAEGR